MSDQSTTTFDALEKRVADLEDYVREIGNVLYEIIQELQSQGQARAIAEPVCPPICPR